MKINVKRLDHLGLVAGKAKDLGLVEIIDELLVQDEQSIVSDGYATLAMILNGLGFVNSPLMLTPEFFEIHAVGLLLHPQIQASHLNRHRLGRLLDKISEYGNEKFFNSIAMKLCKKEIVDCSNYHGDTTTFSVYGKLENGDDTQEVKFAHGYSKDKRQDLKQIILEMVVSRDSGIPLAIKTWSGNKSDSKILADRAKELVDIFRESEGNNCFIADSKVYSKENAPNLLRIKYITRIPASIKLENELIERAIREDQWEEIDESNKYREFGVLHHGIEQRWIVVFSKQSSDRAKKTLEKNIKSEFKDLQSILSRLSSRRFACKPDAEAELKKCTKNLRFHKLDSYEIIEHKRYKKAGRPSNKDARVEYQVVAKFILDDEAFQKTLQQRSCYVVGTNIPQIELSTDKVIAGYKQQDKVEKGFAFLKSPAFFTSSLFLKDTKRIQALLTIMVLSLLVYSIIQRAIRMQLMLLGLTFPNQIRKPVVNPTLRWIFQCFSGINYVTVEINGVVQCLVEGLKDIHIMIIKLLGGAVRKIYEFS